MNYRSVGRTGFDDDFAGWRFIQPATQIRFMARSPLQGLWQ